MKSTTQWRGLALLAGAMLLSTSAMAAPLADAVQQRTETVKFSTGQALTPEGAATLYRKLHSAAERVCQDKSDTIVRFMPDTFTTCVSDAMAKAVSAVGIPSVSLLYMQEDPSARLASLARH